MSRTPSNDSSSGVTAQPIAKSFGLLVLFALAALIVLRHLFGSIRVEGGVR